MLHLSPVTDGGDQSKASRAWTQQVLQFDLEKDPLLDTFASLCWKPKCSIQHLFQAIFCLSCHKPALQTSESHILILEFSDKSKSNMSFAKIDMCWAVSAERSGENLFNITNNYSFRTLLNTASPAKLGCLSERYSLGCAVFICRFIDIMKAATEVGV